MEARLARPRGRAPIGAQTGLMNDANRDRFLTKRWNNILTVGLGLPALIFGLVALTTDAIPDRAAFFVLVVLGAFY